MTQEYTLESYSQNNKGFIKKIISSHHNNTDITNFISIIVIFAPKRTAFYLKSKIVTQASWIAPFCILKGFEFKSSQETAGSSKVNCTQSTFN